MYFYTFIITNPSMRKLLILLFSLFYGIMLGQNIVRGPFLQMAGSHQMTVKFRTNTTSIAKVYIQNQLGNSKLFVANKSTTDHTFVLDSLQPNTKYYYQIGFSENMSIKDSTYFFTTAPVSNSTDKIRFGVIADMYPGATQVKVFESFKKWKSNQDFQFLLTLGDNVYSGATDADYQKNFFNVYANGNVLKQVPLFTALGNHDYDGVGNRIQDSPIIPYFSNFNLPSQAELGGVPSGSEAYYSFDYGNIHLISLDTEGFGKDGKRLIDDNSDQLNWLLADLAKSKSTWKIVYFHHPPFTKGTYDSDVVPILTLIRQKLVPIFEKFKVDLVLNGHSHVYERSKPITNFTGISPEFDPKIHWSQTNSGKYDGTANSCPYFFSSIDSTKNGVLYVVNGVGGATGTRKADAPHKIMEVMVDKLGGFMNFEVQGNRLNAQFFDENGINADRFTIFKDLPLGKVETKSLKYLEKISLEAPWQGDYVWSTNDKSAKIEVSPSKNTLYTVTDSQKCISYSYQVNIIFPDTDEDGVTDNIDVCLNTPKGQKVDVNGCADSQKDTDGDGMMDDKDDCPTIVNPKAPVINQLNEINLSASAGSLYQWFLNGVALANSNAANLQAVSTGNYTVQIKSDKGCMSPMSKSVSVVITEISEELSMLFYPNPVKDVLCIEFPSIFGQVVDMTIFDIRGQIHVKKLDVENKFLIHVGHLPTGVYVIQLKSKENQLTRKIIKE
ncbi:metallophosphoesterase [Aquirufa sp. ROCK2-A2]